MTPGSRPGPAPARYCMDEINFSGAHPPLFERGFHARPCPIYAVVGPSAGNRRRATSSRSSPRPELDAAVAADVGVVVHPGAVHEQQQLRPSRPPLGPLGVLPMPAGAKAWSDNSGKPMGLDAFVKAFYVAERL